MQRQYRWYVEPKNDHTSEVVANYLEDNQAETKLVIRGKKKPLPVFEVTRKELDFLKKSKANAMLDFVIWGRCNEGNPRIWPFDEEKRVKIRAVRKVARLIRKRQAVA